MDVICSVERYLKNTFENDQVSLFGDNDKQFTVKTQYAVQYAFNTQYTKNAWSICKADVALLEDGKLIAFAFTMEQPILQKDKESGIRRLKDNLIRTFVQFGIFASSVNSDKWQYYKRSGKREPIEISRVKFENAILGGQSKEQPTEPTPNPEQKRVPKLTPQRPQHQRQTQDDLYHFVCPVGEKVPRAFRGHFDLKTPNNDYLLTDIPDTSIRGSQNKSQLKVTPFSTDPYSVKLWKMTKEHREKIRAKLASEVIDKPTPKTIYQQGITSVVNRPSTEPDKNRTPTASPDKPKTPQPILQKPSRQKTETQPTPSVKETLKPKLTPRTENDIREIVRKYLQQRIDIPIRDDKTLGREIFEPRWEFKKEYTIQFGRERTGRADLVLLLNNTPFVIVECKRPGIEGKGKEQLKSYTNAARPRFGIFANDQSPDNWCFYDTTNEFIEITQKTFNQEVREAHRTERNIEREAQKQQQQRIETRANEMVTLKDVNERADKIIDEKAKQRITENAIQSSVATQLQQQIKNLQSENIRLKAEVSEKSGCAIWGWCLFAIAVFILIAVGSG